MWPKATISFSPVTAMRMTHSKAGVHAFTPWFTSPTDGCDQLQPRKDTRHRAPQRSRVASNL